MKTIVPYDHYAACWVTLSRHRHVANTIVDCFVNQGGSFAEGEIDPTAKRPDFLQAKIDDTAAKRKKGEAPKAAKTKSKKKKEEAPYVKPSSASSKTQHQHKAPKEDQQEK